MSPRSTSLPSLTETYCCLTREPSLVSRLKLTVAEPSVAENSRTGIDTKPKLSDSVVASIPAPGHGSDSGLAWAEGSLWVGQYRDRKIHQIDPATGAIQRTIESNRFVTGVTWVDGELCHGTWEADASDIRRIDPRSGAVLERLE